jgi:hypothetical protein
VTALAEDTSVITTPGVYDIPEDVYHADPVPGRSLSCSGAKRLLPPSCPAKFRHEQLHGRPDKRAFDFGHAAHAKVLGVGAPVVVVQKTAKDGTKSDATDLRTKSAQEHVEEIRAAGMVPLLREEVEQVDGMAKALREHPVAAALFDPERGGKPEQSLFRQDPLTGVWLRSRLDWLPQPSKDGRMILADYKTTISCDWEAIRKTVAAYRYDMQAVFYSDMALSLGLAEQVPFVFVLQEKAAPYLVRVVEPDSTALRIGEHDVRRAIDLYAACVEQDRWPSYSDDVELLPLPYWFERQYEDVL